ncbi:MAG TPA: VanZ family protein [Longimicrobiaceae bacterium]|nr:VanZ family protein [Longimicrobiaceae bacterium]
MSRRVLAWVPALAWAAAIYLVSARESVSIPSFWGADKVLHFGTYALLGFLLAHGAATSGLAPRWAVALGWAYGASDELHQAFVPGRSADPADWAADALGVLAGTFAYACLVAWRRGRSRTPAMAGTDR